MVAKTVASLETFYFQHTVGNKGHTGDLAEHTDLCPSARLLTQLSKTRYFMTVKLFSFTPGHKLHALKARKVGRHQTAVSIRSLPTASVGWATARLLTWLRSESQPPILFAGSVI
jgi:hypothetical protein